MDEAAKSLDPRVIVALDFPDAGAALTLARRLSPRACRVKVGNELFTASGPALVDSLVQRGFDVFLDLKFHDIPRTVASACKAAAALGVWMVDVHALGGSAMLSSAREALEGASPRPYLIAVTVLTSMSEADLTEVGIAGPAVHAVLGLARLARERGLDGVVCSPQEARALRTACGERFLLVTPGIRLRQDAAEDQKRIATPAEAIGSGASYLVVGRPITRAADPLGALDAINREVAGVAARPNA